MVVRALALLLFAEGAQAQDFYAGNLAEAQRLSVDIEPMPGAEVQEAVMQILATPRDVIARTQAALEGKGR